MGEAKRNRALYAQRKLNREENDPWCGGPRLPVGAVHEAGHAMGRYQVAKTLGHPTEQAVSSIDMGECPPKGFQGITGMKVYWGRPATTYGPMWSKDIENSLRSLIPVTA